MNYKVRLTAQGENDLRNIFEYIAFDLQSVQNAVGSLPDYGSVAVSLSGLS